MVPLFDVTKKAVVVIDVYRATSAIVAALGSGVKEIIPVSTVEEAKEYLNKNYRVAAERKGAIVEGFDLGNSPVALSDESLKDESIVLTTSNGTKALLKAKEAKELLIGAFLNESAIVDYIDKNHNNVVFLCAGWRERFNLEDTLVAGAMAELLIKRNWVTHCDSTLAAMHLYQTAETNVKAFMANASHTLRLSHLHLEEDIAYCNQKNVFNVVPAYKDGVIKLI